jgi:hypothetical protein
MSGYLLSDFFQVTVNGYSAYPTNAGNLGGGKIFGKQP